MSEGCPAAAHIPSGQGTCDSPRHIGDGDTSGGKRGAHVLCPLACRRAERLVELPLLGNDATMISVREDLLLESVANQQFCHHGGC